MKITPQKQLFGNQIRNLESVLNDVYLTNVKTQGNKKPPEGGWKIDGLLVLEGFICRYLSQAARFFGNFLFV